MRKEAPWGAINAPLTLTVESLTDNLFSTVVRVSNIGTEVADA